MNPITVNKEKCIGCSLCVNDCPNACLYLENGKAYFGELTFTPGGGFDSGRLPESDLLFGSMVNLENIDNQ